MSALTLLLASNLLFSHASATPAASLIHEPHVQAAYGATAGYWRQEWRTIFAGYDACGLPVYRRVLVRVWVPAFTHHRVARVRHSHSGRGW